MVMTTGLKNYSDVHYTHPALARLILNYVKPSGVILEPFSGGGAFYDHMGEGALWCEQAKGRDFFDFHTPVDWIVTNPPYSNLTDVMRHAFTISQHTVFLVPLSKVYSSAPRMALVNDVASIRRQFYLGPGRKIGFDIGFPFAAMEFVKGYQGPTFTIDISREAHAAVYP